ncbi:DMT family transporter [Vibrio zhanjiangensis]|nr:DMT family transporter [Vibrio zhanjiangensis]
MLAPILFLLMWSSGAVMVKVGLQYASVWSFLAARSIVSLACLFLLYFVIKYREKVKFVAPSKSELIKILFVGVLLQVSYLSFYFLSIDSNTSPGIVTLILGFQPLLTPFLCGQRLTLRSFLLLSMGFIGLAISLFGSSEMDKIAFLGVFFSVVALLSISIGTVLQANISHHIVQNMFYQSLLSAPIFLVVSMYCGGNITWTLEFCISLVWMSIVVSVGALLLLMYMAKQDGASSVSVLFYAVPVLAYFFDFVIFRNGLSVITILGMVIVAVSVIFYRKLR